MHPVDDRTGSKEQHRLEEGVGEQVEHGDRVNADASGHEHIAQLRTGRIRDHAFDVVLHKAHSRREERGGGAKEDDEVGGLGRVFHQRRHAADQEDTGGHHGCRVDQRRHRGRAFHRVGKPGVQDQLCRFTHRTDEQQEGQQVRCVPIGPQEVDVGLCQRRCRCEHIVKADAVGHVEQTEDTQSKTKVPHTVHYEGFDRRRVGRGFLIIKADQQVRGHTHAFPAKEHLQQVVRGHQHQHGEGEEGQIGEETGAIAFALELRIMGHVAHGIQMNQRRDRGHNDQHDRG